MSADSRREAANGNQSGFYVEERCCVSCGVPQSIAPELVGWKDETELLSCYWIRQPKKPDEVDRAIKILHSQEIGCHRYAGLDRTILKRAPAEQCDHLHPETAFRYSSAFGASDVPLKFELFTSKEGLLTRFWRRVTRRGGV